MAEDGRQFSEDPLRPDPSCCPTRRPRPMRCPDHDAWTTTYNLTAGRGDVYAWMLANANAKP
jgi:hypothetical protein